MKKTKELTILTVDDIRLLKPCNDPLEYEGVTEDTTGTVLDLVDLSVSRRDKLWVLFELYEKKRIHRDELLVAIQKIGIDTKDDRGITPMMYAVYYGTTETVRLLLDKGVDIETRTNYGWSPLTYAISYGETEIVKALLAKGANIEAKDKDGWTALMYASDCSLTEIVKFLLAKGADIDARNNYGRTALMYASDRGKTEIIKLLQKAEKEERK